MGKIFMLLGKSASGKDAVYKQLIADQRLGLKPYIGYTTRPRRSGEENGREYFFTDEKQLKRYEDAGQLIEKRIYHTVHGDWTYFSVAEDLTEQNYLYIGTLESYLPLRGYYGSDVVIPVYIQVEDGIRLQRALDRERQQEQPRYAELCRRFLADEEDFSPRNLEAAGIDAGNTFDNVVFEDCVERIRTYIMER